MWYNRNIFSVANFNQCNIKRWRKTLRHIKIFAFGNVFLYFCNLYSYSVNFVKDKESSILKRFSQSTSITSTYLYPLPESLSCLLLAWMKEQEGKVPSLYHDLLILGFSSCSTAELMALDVGLVLGFLS